MKRNTICRLLNLICVNVAHKLISIWKKKTIFSFFLRLREHWYFFFRKFTLKNPNRTNSMYLTQTPFWTQRVSMTEMHEFIYMRDSVLIIHTRTNTRPLISFSSCRIFAFKRCIRVRQREIEQPIRAHLHASTLITHTYTDKPMKKTKKKKKRPYERHTCEYFSLYLIS